MLFLEASLAVSAHIVVLRVCANVCSVHLPKLDR